MADLTLRNVKASPLTSQEVDDNFSNLNDDKVEKSGDTLTGDLAFGDNVRATFGDSNDLRIYHEGTASFIQDAGFGNLKIIATNLQLKNASDTENYLVAIDGGATSLYHNGSAKFETTSSGVDVTGNITVSGTVDGRDIAADGTTLDAVASTYVDVSGDTMTGDLAFGDNVKAKFGAGNDLQISHSGTLSQIQDAGTGELRISSNGTAVRLWDTANLQNLAVFYVGGKSGIYHNGTETLATTSSGVDVTGTLVADGLTVDGGNAIQLNASSGTDSFKLIQGGTQAVIIADSPDGAGNLLFRTTAAGVNTDRLQITAGGDIEFYEDTGTTAKLTWDASAEELQFKDNVKAEFGDGGDFQIEHNGTNTKITNNTGTLKIVQNANDGDVEISSDNGSGATALYFVADGSTGEAKLYHYGSEKLATKSTGIDVTGTVTADGLTVDGGGTFQGSSTQIDLIETDIADNNTRLRQTVGDFFIQTVSDDKATLVSRLNLDHASGDISFYDDAGTSQDFYWDASTSRLGLGTTSPSADGLEVANKAGTIAGVTELFVTGNTSGKSVLALGDFANKYVQHIISDHTNNSLQFNTASPTLGGRETMRIDSNGNVGIGTTSPSQPLHVNAGTTDAVALFESTDNTARIQIKDNGGTANVQAGNGNLQLMADVNDEVSGSRIQFFVDGTSEVARFDSSGRLGIGTTSPSRDLVVKTGGSGFISVVSSPAQDVGLLLGDTDSDSVCQLKYSNSSNALLIHTNGSEAMRIDSSGRLGIGTTSPGDKLDISAGNINLSNGYSLAWGGSTGRPYISGDKTSQFMAFGTNGIEAMRIDSNRKLLIGTSNSDPWRSEQDVIQLGDNGSISHYQGLLTTLNHNYYVDSAGNTKYSQTGQEAFTINLNSFNNAIEFKYAPSGTAGDTFSFNTAAVIDTNGRLGIGTTSPSAPLQVKTSSSNAIRVTRDGAENQYLELNEADGSKHVIKAVNGAGASKPFEITNDWGDIRFRTSASSGADSEAMRIDSSGNLLVGKTAFDESSDGAELRSSGFSTFTRNNNNVMVINRRTSDGDIVKFKKDGSTVGSIGVDYSDNLFLSGNSSHSGLSFGTDGIIPYANSDVRDGSEDLGNGAYRWRNLYLSGGVYLGGTGSANLLDDYEEGTWTPVASRFTGGAITATYSTQAGTYTKIGNLVYITCYIVIDSVTSQGSSYTTIEGLPFSYGGGQLYVNIMGAVGNALSPTTPITNAYPSGTRLFVSQDKTGGFPPEAHNWQTGTIRISGCYYIP